MKILCPIGRKKLADLRRVAEQAGWLDSSSLPPEDDLLTTRLDETAPEKRAASTVSTLELHRECIAAWLAQGVDGTVIHSALVRDYGYICSYSSVRRMLARLCATLAGSLRPFHDGWLTSRPAALQSPKLPSARQFSPTWFIRR